MATTTTATFTATIELSAAGNKEDASAEWWLERWASKRADDLSKIISIETTKIEVKTTKPKIDENIRIINLHKKIILDAIGSDFSLRAYKDSLEIMI